MNKLSPESTKGLQQFMYILVSLIAIVTILVYTEEYVVPFVIALIIWFIIHELRENLQWIPWIDKNLPIWLQSLIAFVIINLVLFGIMELVYYNSSVFYENFDIYESNFQIILLQLNELTGIDVASKVNQYTHDFDLEGFLGSMINTTTTLFGDVFLILIYVIFLLIEETIFPAKLKAFYPDEKEQEKKEDLFYKMDQNIGKYLRLKSIVSFLTAILSFFVLLIFGVEGAVFWALLIFVLNFIPTIGSLIATVFPAIFIVLQMAELAPFIYVMLSVGAIQIIIGNVVEPKLMGNSLNMSSLVVVLSLTIWGAIWGIMGMILSIPITVMMIIVCEEIPSLRFIAVALSEKGKLSDPPKKVRVKK
ncbi:MAG: AI-2E family transporter [Reichenbachiella sp.]